MATNDGRIDRLGRLYRAGNDATGARWAEWEQDRATARRFLRDNSLALFAFNETMRRYRMDERHPLSYEAWITFLSALKAALEPVCDTEALADALATSNERAQPTIPASRTHLLRTTSQERGGYDD